MVAVALTLPGVVPTHANAGTTLDFSYSANGTFLDPGAVPWTVTGSGFVTFTNNPTSVADSFDFAWTSSYDGNMFHFDANTLQNFSISGATISFLTTSVQKIGGGGDFEDLQVSGTLSSATGTVFDSLAGVGNVVSGPVTFGPEPTSLLLFGGGIASLGVLRLRRRQDGRPVLLKAVGSKTEMQAKTRRR